MAYAERFVRGLVGDPGADIVLCPELPGRTPRRRSERPTSGTMLLLGMANQFWLHPRIDALRAAGDERALLTILMRRFPAIVAVEVLLGLTVLMVAPFLHGSARNQAFQAEAAKQATSVTAVLPKIPAKEVTTSTWVLGASETVAVASVMIIGFAVSGRIAHRRVLAAAAPP